MLIWVMAYVAVLYVRPSEIASGLGDFRVAVIASAVAVVAAACSLLVEPRQVGNHPLDKSVLGFWAAIVASNLAWGWIGGAYEGLVGFLPAVICYFLIRLAVRDGRQFRAMVALLVCLNLFQAINGIIERQTGVGLGGVVPVEGGRVRGTGIFNDPNDLALTVVMALPFVIAAMRARGWMRRIAAATAVAAMVICVLYTSSRGAVLALAAVAVVTTIGRLGKTRAVIFGVIALAAIVAVGPSRSGDIDAREESAQERVQAWSAGLQMLKSKPLFGVGYGQFTEFHERVAHNSFVHSFGELGLFGEIWFVSLFYWYFRSVTPKNDPDGWGRTLAASGAGVLTCIWFLSRQYVTPLYVLLALGASYGSIREKQQSQSLHWTVRAVAANTGLAIAVVATVYVSVRLLAHWG